MARIERCPNGHFYDRDVNETCPYCNPDASINLDRSVRTGAVEEVSSEPIFDPGRIPTLPVDDEKTNKKMEDYADKTTWVDRGIARGKGKSSDAAETVDTHKVVTGWLAAIEGPYRGKSFEIYVGYTKIGRAPGNDIILSEDSSISSRHANTHYSVKKNQFHLQCADSPTNSVEVDGVELLSNEKAELHPYSRVELGNSVFLFIPFCSDVFRWQDLNQEA